MKMPWLKTTEPVTSSLTKTYTSNNPTADGALTVTLAETLWTAMERRMEAVQPKIGEKIFGGLKTFLLRSDDMPMAKARQPVSS